MQVYEGTKNGYNSSTTASFLENTQTKVQSSDDRQTDITEKHQIKNSVPGTIQGNSGTSVLAATT